MSPRGVAFYTLRAAIFAAAVCAVYALACRARGRKPGPGRLLAVAYLAALIQITVLRGGVDWARVFAGGRRRVQLRPLGTILPVLRRGDWWSFTYHTLGNLVWFIPLGMLLRKRRAGQALLIGAAFSLCIEASQYLLRTGMTDIDDVLLNASGALLGWALSHARSLRR